MRGVLGSYISFDELGICEIFRLTFPISINIRGEAVVAGTSPLLLRKTGD
jgi:hypothetical protein